MTDEVAISKTEVLEDAKELMQEMVDFGQTGIYLTSNTFLQEEKPNFYKGVLDDEEKTVVKDSLSKIFSKFDSTSEAAVDATLVDINEHEQTLAQKLCVQVFYRGDSVLFSFPLYNIYDGYFCGYVSYRRIGNELKRVCTIDAYEYPEIFLLGKRIIERYLIDCC